MPTFSLQWSGSLNPTGVSFSAASVHRFLYFRGYVTSNGSSLSTNEQTLLRFCSHLADRLHHSSIKVYLSAIRSLHIDQGFPDPLVNSLQLQRLLPPTTPVSDSRLHAYYPAFLGYPQLRARHAVGCLLPRFLWTPQSQEDSPQMFGTTVTRPCLQCLSAKRLNAIWKCEKLSHLLLTTNVLLTNLCDAGYVGYTSRHLHQRIKEHKRASSSIGQHFRVKHSSELKGLIIILAFERSVKANLTAWCFKCFFINELRPTLNVQSDSLRAKAFK